MVQFDPYEMFELSGYNPQWPKMFEEECARIRDVIGDHIVEIEHVGSTSVPGLSAKPIIDLLMIVESFWGVDEYKKRLEKLGYHHHSHEDDADRLFLWKGEPRTHHLHIVEYATWEHQRHLLFRDYLRNHPDVAQQYENVKRELAEIFKTNRPAYTRGKTAFIKSIMAFAVEEIADPDLRKLADNAQNEKRGE
jgi:GrpB-like predicted nucleotidyltransferase (UPF0157 family)